MKRMLLIAVAVVLVAGTVWIARQTRETTPKEDQRPGSHKEAQESQEAKTASSHSRDSRNSRPTPLSIQPIVTARSDATIRSRIEALRSLGTRLTAEERQSLNEFLLSTARVEGIQDPQLHWLKNEIMTVLRNQETGSLEVTDALISNYRNRKQDVVIRDYSLQHLSLLYENASQKDEIRQVLWEAVAESSSSLAGTALLSLHRLAETHEEFDSKAVSKKALSFAADQHCEIATCLTAIQVCARMGETRALPAARRLAETEGSVPLRISAIAAVGDLGGPESIPLLEKLASGDDARLRPAAESALKRLQRRLALTERSATTTGREG